MWNFLNNKIKIANNTDIMSSTIITNAKLDTKIEIPEGFIGLIYYREKHLFSLPEGSYNLKDENFLLVRDKNAMHNRKKKKQLYNFIIHFVTTNDSDIEISCNRLTDYKQKSNYILKSNFSINNPKAFASILLTNWYKTNNKRTNSYVTNFFKEFFDYILKRKIYKSNEDLKLVANKYFKKYGVNINRISLNILNANTFIPQPLNEIEDANAPLIQQTPTEIIEQKPLIFSENKQLVFNTPKLENKDRFCPKCQSKQIDGSPYCHICGTKNNNNLLKK